MGVLGFHETAFLGLGGPPPKPPKPAMKIMGVLEDEGDPMLAQQSVSTTKTGVTVFSKQKIVPVERRQMLTRAVEELEFLVSDPSIYVDAILSKLREARRHVMATATWGHASYAGGARESYDTPEDLAARLDDVQAILEKRLGYKLTGRASVMGGLGGTGPFKSAAGNAAFAVFWAPGKAWMAVRDSVFGPPAKCVSSEPLGCLFADGTGAFGGFVAAGVFWSSLAAYGAWRLLRKG